MSMVRLGTLDRGVAFRFRIVRESADGSATGPVSGVVEKRRYDQATGELYQVDAVLRYAGTGGLQVLRSLHPNLLVDEL